MSIHRIETLIIGGGQAGLSLGHHLQKRGRPFVIVDASARIGDSWRARWDSMRLFTPARRDGLPGMRFPARNHSFPAAGEMADYLESYAAAFELPVHTGVRVDALGRTDAGMFLVAAGDRRYEADNVVLATGPFQRPYVPEFAGELGATVTQLHSSAYRNPRELPDGDALVVGAGNSGADIALELAAGRRVLLSGDLGGQIPINIEGLSGRMMFPILWRVWTYVLTFGTPVGRRALPKMEGNEPRIRVKRKHLVAAGVESVSRTVGVRDGRPLLADGTVVDAATVVWATGYRPAYDWVDLPVLGAGGEIETDHAGAALSQPGLYRLGRPFLYAFNSHTVGGVGRDAERIARRIAAAARPTDEYRLAVASVAA